ncbi:MAG: DNA polymerase II [Bacteroidetes bacterium]|nr:DNA polymerase II [Bacteroidota bacterium]
MDSANVFLLTGEWNDFKGRNIIRFIGTSEEFGPVELIFDRTKPVLFIDRDSTISEIGVKYLRKSVELKTFAKKDVDAIYFNTQRDLKAAAEILYSRNIQTFESDVDPVKRFLMERFINCQANVSGEAKKKNRLITFVNPKIKPCEVSPRFTIVSLDIETGVKNSALYSIAVHVTGKIGETKKVFMIGLSKKKTPQYLTFFDNEKDLLENFIAWCNEIDPDIIIGWHVIGFDLMFLERKFQEHNISFDLARGEGKVSLRNRKSGGYFAFIPGRIVIDGPPSLRSSFFSFEDYKLETVAQELLKTGKTIKPDKNKIHEIEKLFAEDKIKLAEYNLQDTVLVSEIFKKAGLIELSVRRAQLSGLLMDQLGMMTAAFDHFYLPKIHRAGFIAIDKKDISEMAHSAGGYVLDPKPGLYDDVVVLDFKSLYPSIIRTFKIDPISRLLSDENTIETPGGYKFSSTNYFLPNFIEQLMIQRSEAVKKKDKQLSQAIKILMNSFYGVMGSYGCRFYHPDLPSAITSTGHYLLLGSKEYFQNKGYEVVYGDTDSLFVKLKIGEGTSAEKIARSLAGELNNYWKEKLKSEFKVESFLEIEFEKHYKKFIITPMRRSESGAKKRYAGLLLSNEIEKIEFVGMEFVRSDWTRLAKEFQVELYERLFHNLDVADWIREIVSKVNKGELDDKLIYRKRLRKGIDEYTKNIPPQVRAARMIDSTENVVYYVITKRGPIPIELDHSDIDYQHYIEKQLKPIADSVLMIFGESFDSINKSSQLNFFE